MAAPAHSATPRCLWPSILHRIGRRDIPWKACNQAVLLAASLPPQCNCASANTTVIAPERQRARAFAIATPGFGLPGPSLIIAWSRTKTSRLGPKSSVCTSLAAAARSSQILLDSSSSGFLLFTFMPIKDFILLFKLL
jgi:hypothetical protein